jgi:hypothetical protein
MSGDWCEKHKRNFAGDVVCWECVLGWKKEIGELKKQCDDYMMAGAMLMASSTPSSDDEQKARMGAPGYGPVTAPVEDTPAPTCNLGQEHGEDIPEVIAKKVCERVKARLKQEREKMIARVPLCICDIVAEEIRAGGHGVVRREVTHAAAASSADIAPPSLSRLQNRPALSAKGGGHCQIGACAGADHCACDCTQCLEAK